METMQNSIAYANSLPITNAYFNPLPSDFAQN